MRLFVTVGAQMPFDRLIRAVDAWAADHRGHEILAQIGESDAPPQNIEWARFLEPSEFDRAYDEADAIVGHAGIGTLFAAMERGKPIVVMPREAAQRETRNDHQIATARRFEALAGVAVAWDEAELGTLLERATELVPSRGLTEDAKGPLIQAIRAFVDED